MAGLSLADTLEGGQGPASRDAPCSMAAVATITTAAGSGRSEGQTVAPAARAASRTAPATAPATLSLKTLGMM